MLQLSDNSKVKFRNRHYNTFGLMYGLPKNGGTCCGATTGKGGCLNVRDGYKRETCYMSKVTAIYKGVASVLLENTNALQNKSRKEMVVILSETVKKFLEENSELPYFRLHYSGDFFSSEYAKAWSEVFRLFPHVRFWAYTRSHQYVKYLADADNLTLFLSVDPANYASGMKVYSEFVDKPNVGLAWMGNESPAGIKWVTCPETSGVLKNTKNVGACGTCRLCVDNYKSKVRHIKFLIH